MNLEDRIQTEEMPENETDILEHYGTPRHSGRYPWGSGENPYQSIGGLGRHVESLRKQGLSDVQIAKGMGMTTQQLRDRVSISGAKERAALRSEILKLKDKGYSNMAIGRRLRINESSVRSYLDPVLHERKMVALNTAEALKKCVDENGFVNVGLGVEHYIGSGISRTKFKTALQAMEDDGYVIKNIKVVQRGTGLKTTVMVAAKPGTTTRDIYLNADKIRMPNRHTEDDGKTFNKTEPPRSISSDRIKINYSEDGGVEKDGVIELRRGVPELSLGNAHYAQVRIAVDGTHYLKGMAVYKDNMPDGVDIIFNTNKHRGTPAMSSDPKASQVFKPMKYDPDDPGNPFGASLKTHDEGDFRDLFMAQRHYTDLEGKKQLSALNIVNEEGNWNEWSRTLSSQFLSKQPEELAKRQLDLAEKQKRTELDEILQYTEPSVKARMLQSFADECDADAVHLKAAGMPGQAQKVILPITSLKDNEIYAPHLNDGDHVALIRYPHGGRFEIPELVVNNRNQEGRSILGSSPRDAVGINKHTADILSGADFDGDTVVVIPNPDHSVKNAKPLKGLEGFDAKERYPHYEGMVRMTKAQTQQEMGKVSNLITDMTLKGAPDSDIVKAVRHSMVVIDAEKHYLNWKQSEQDNDILALKNKYQGHYNEKGNWSTGASTLISRSKSDTYVDERTEGQWRRNPETGKIKKVYSDPETGEKLYSETGRTKRVFGGKDENGRTIWKDSGKKVQTKTTQMAEAKDAFQLSSGTDMENIYARHANALKAMANEARLALGHIPKRPRNPSAAEAYSEEVASLKNKLMIAEKNSPLERQAQLLAGHIFQQKLEDNPGWVSDDKKKASDRALKEARLRVGAHKQLVIFTPKEWEAVQAGAISSTMLNKLLKNANEKQIKQLAMPKTSKGMSAARISLAKQMIARGYTLKEVADSLGVTTGTLDKALYS